jgi:hypothetical protein
MNTDASSSISEYRTGVTPQTGVAASAGAPKTAHGNDARAQPG